MEIFRLVLAHPQHPEKPRLVAEHLDPAWLKQRGHRNADPVEINADPPPPNRPSGRRTPARDDPGRGLSM